MEEEKKHREKGEEEEKKENKKDRTGAEERESMEQKFTINEINRAIKKIKKKAAGIDGISMEA